MLPSSTVRAELGRMMELAQQGFHCSEILLFMGLHAQGKTNPDAIRAVSSLAGGIGSSGDICGAFSGGACLLGLYGGRGAPDEDEDPRLRIMISDLMDWFTEEQERRYGGIHCREIIEEDPRNMPLRCPQIVAAVYRKVRSILDGHGFDWHAGAQPLPRDRETRTCGAACPVAAAL